MKKIFAVISFLVLMMSGIAQAETQLTVYTDLPANYVAAYTKAFNGVYPDIKLNWISDSAGPITARILAEKDAPQADVVFGLALTSIYLLDNQGLLESYRVKEYDLVRPQMRDERPNPVWVGSNGWSSAICYNTVEAKKLNLPAPKSWEDLLNPVYKGHLIMPNPSTSSTGYMTVYGWIELMGEEKAWQYMEQLHKNINMYSSSGCKVGQMAAQGETPIGLSAGQCIGNFLAMGAPVELIYPPEGVAWDAEAVAILKGRPNIEASRKLMDFATSEALAQYGVENASLNDRIDYQDKSAAQGELLKIDFAKAAADRERIVTQWRERFEGSN